MALLARVKAGMNKIAPLALADSSWDNVGVLLESPPPLSSTEDAEAKKNVFLTIDLTEKVLDEAIGCNTGVIVAYHPPIFSGLKRLNLADPKQRIVLRCVQNGISIYSPHTSVDACKGGNNDLLIQACGTLNQTSVKPVQPVMLNGKKATAPQDIAVCETGYGRIAKFEVPAKLDDVVASLKGRLGVPTLRVAVPDNFESVKLLSSVAVCAGSGSSVLRAVKEDIDLFVTGEMSHHEVLAANANGTVVILAEHTNSERFWLKEKLKDFMVGYLAENGGGDNRVIVSEADKDPLRVW